MKLPAVVVRFFTRVSSAGKQTRPFIPFRIPRSKRYANCVLLVGLSRLTVDDVPGVGISLVAVTVDP